MPELTVAEIEKAIRDGRLTLLSIDTSIFSQYQNGLEHGLLQRLAQFEASDVDLVLSDVVVREVHRHMVEAAVESDSALKKAVRLSGKARNLDMPATPRRMTPTRWPRSPPAWPISDGPSRALSPPTAS
ncbi:hypothetical protein ACTTAF_07280 [Rhodobacter capsulatus]|uniref:hypothetical protein n=1 Tax=Rhodobacter capsulatus TaxID=1061 RepID=UPI001F51CBA4|nr:hypothetical protein [Rhodobacter capsulatus]